MIYRPCPAYVVTKGIGDTWKIIDYVLLILAGGPGDEPEIYRDNIYDKEEANRIALRLNIEWWDELSRIHEELSQDRRDPKEDFL